MMNGAFYNRLISVPCRVCLYGDDCNDWLFCWFLGCYFVTSIYMNNNGIHYFPASFLPGDASLPMHSFPRPACI